MKLTKVTTGKVLTVESMNPQIRNAEYAVRGALPIRAEALSKVRLGNAKMEVTSVSHFKCAFRNCKPTRTRALIASSFVTLAIPNS